MKGVALGLQNLHAAFLTHASLHPNNVFAIGREKGIVGDYDFTKIPVSVINKKTNKKTANSEKLWIHVLFLGEKINVIRPGLDY